MRNPFRRRHVRVPGPTGAGTPWPPVKSMRIRIEDARMTPEGWMRRDVADVRYPPGICPVRMRTPGAISCFWPCTRPEGHDGAHRWESRSGHATFTDADVADSIRRRPSVAEMSDADRFWTPANG